MLAAEVADVLAVKEILDGNLDDPRLIAALVSWKHGDYMSVAGNMLENPVPAEKSKTKGGRVIKEEVPDDEPGF